MPHRPSNIFSSRTGFLKTRFVTSRESLRQQTKTFTLRYFQNKVLHCSTVKSLDSVAQGTVQRSPLEAKPRKRESCSGSAGPELERAKKNMAACGLRVAGNAKTVKLTNPNNHRQHGLTARTYTFSSRKPRCTQLSLQAGLCKLTWFRTLVRGLEPRQNVKALSMKSVSRTRHACSP